MQTNSNFAPTRACSIEPIDEREKILSKKANELVHDGHAYPHLLDELIRFNEVSCVPALSRGEVNVISLRAWQGKHAARESIQLYYQWLQEPMSLSATVAEAPALSPELVPERLRTWIFDSAERMQIPPESIMVPALVGFSSIVGRKIGICPKQHDDWMIVPNLWGALVADSPSLISAAIIEAMRPIDRLDEQDRSRDSLRQKLARPRDLLESNLADRTWTEHQNDRREEAKMSSTRHMRYRSHESLPENITHAAAQNNNGILLVHDDLCHFLNKNSKPKFARERALFNGAVWGNHAHSLEQPRNNEPDSPYHTVSLFGLMQSDTLLAYLRKTDERCRRDCEMLSRFQILLSSKSNSEWKYIDKIPNFIARESVFDVFRKIDSAPLPISNFVPAVRFTKAAQEAFEDWHKSFECKLRSFKRDGLALKSHLAHYRTLMPSLALLLWILEGPENIHGWGSVSLAATNGAIKWCEFLEKHATAIYCSRKNERAMAARRLATSIERGDVMEGASIKSLYRNQVSELSKPLIGSALKALEKRNWLRVAKEKHRGDTVRRIWLHPKFSRHHRNIFELPS